jgi:hypothetical protein
VVRHSVLPPAEKARRLAEEAKRFEAAVESYRFPVFALTERVLNLRNRAYGAGSAGIDFQADYLAGSKAARIASRDRRRGPHLIGDWIERCDCVNDFLKTEVGPAQDPPVYLGPQDAEALISLARTAKAGIRARSKNGGSYLLCTANVSHDEARSIDRAIRRIDNNQEAFEAAQKLMAEEMEQFWNEHAM